jgi:hypothetical protein
MSECTTANRPSAAALYQDHSADDAKTVVPGGGRELDFPLPVMGRKGIRFANVMEANVMEANVMLDAVRPYVRVASAPLP